MIVSALATVVIVQAPAAKPVVVAPSVKPAATAELTVKFVKSVPGLRPLAYAPGPSGGWVAMTLENNSVRIFNAETRVTSKTLLGHPQPAFAIAWSADGAWLATGDESARIMLWDARTGAKLKEVRQHTRGIQNLSFNLGRTMLLSTGKDDAVKVWDLATHKVIQTVLGQGANLYSATFHPKGLTFATGTIGSGARIYDAKTGIAKNFLTAPSVQEVNDVAFNPAGTRLVTSARAGATRIWDLTTLKGINNMAGHGDWVVKARFSPNGKYLATSSSDKTVRIYNAHSYKQVALIENQSPVGSSLAWTADGKWLLTTGGDDALQIHAITPTQAIVTAAKPKPVIKRRIARR